MSKEYPFEIIETQNCVNNCSIAERQKGLCRINFQPKEEESKEAEEQALENIKEELTKGFDASEVDKGENVVIKQKDSTITISTSHALNGRALPQWHHAFCSRWNGRIE